MADPINEIREAVAATIQTQIGVNKVFEGFRLEPLYDRNKAYTPPLILLLIKEPDVVDYTIGDDVRVDTVTVEASLVFKEGHRKTVEATVLSRVELADWYLAQLLTVMGSSDLPDYCSNDEPTGESNMEPADQPYLFGCIVRLRVEYNVRLDTVQY